MKVIPGYHPPSDYRRPTKTQEKVYVPVNDYPEINFSMLANPPNFNLLPTISFLFVIIFWSTGILRRYTYSRKLIQTLTLSLFY